MPNILKVTPEEVNEKARQITALKEQMDQLLSDLSGRIRQMVQNDWIGNAGDAYENQFVVLEGQVVKSLDVIQQHANNLSEAANKYQEMENNHVTTVSSLDATDIF